MRKYLVLSNHLIVREDVGAAVAQGLYGSQLTDELVAQANAAPELLQACEGLLLAFGGDVPGWLSPEAEAAMRAIAKARGEA